MKNFERTALYIRVTSDAQNEGVNSLENQKQRLVQFCELQGITDYEFYIDSDPSESDTDRPEMTRMINDVLSGKIVRGVVNKLDRIHSYQKSAISLLTEVFEPCGCSFVSLYEGLDTSTALGKAIVGMVSAFAELESENIEAHTI